MSTSDKESKPSMGLPTDISEGVYVGGCFTIVGVGFLGAVKYSMNKDKELFRKNKIPAMYAAKAFLYGTLLCVGTFASVGAVVVFATGITNAKDFGKSMRKLFGNRTPEEEFEKDHEIEFDNLKQDITEFFIENDETNQARDLLIPKPVSEVVVVPEADKPPRESPILSLFKDGNGEYSKKSPILAWLKEKRAELLGHPSLPTTTTAGAEPVEVKVDTVVVKEIVEAALKEPSEASVSDVGVTTATSNTRTWMQFWSDTVYGSSSGSSSSGSNSNR